MSLIGKTISKPIKIVVPDKALMQFDCCQCHKPHISSRPDRGNCLRCHENLLNLGKYNTHVQIMGIKCKYRHKPHIRMISTEER